MTDWWQQRNIHDSDGLTLLLMMPTHLGRICSLLFPFMYRYGYTFTYNAVMCMYLSIDSGSCSLLWTRVRDTRRVYIKTTLRWFICYVTTMNYYMEYGALDPGTWGTRTSIRYMSCQPQDHWRTVPTCISVLLSRQPMNQLSVVSDVWVSESIEHVWVFGCCTYILPYWSCIGSREGVPKYCVSQTRQIKRRARDKSLQIAVDRFGSDPNKNRGRCSWSLHSTVRIPRSL